MQRNVCVAVSVVALASFLTPASLAQKNIPSYSSIGVEVLPPSPPVVGMSSTTEQRVTLKLTNATISDVLRWLGRKYQVNAVCDAYLDDVQVADVTYNDAPLSEVWAKIGAGYHRDILRVNGVVVFRRPGYFLGDYYDTQARTTLGKEWSRDAEPATVTRADPAKTIEARQDAVAALALPPRRINVNAYQATMSEVATSFGKTVTWPVRVGDEIKNKRITIQMSDAPPGAVLEAITLLCNARQEVAIGKSDAQKTRESALFAEAFDHSTPREKAARLLRPDLLKALTSEQLAAVSEGKVEVPISVTSLPADLQKRVMSYIFAEADRIDKIGTLLVDRGRLKDLFIVFLPHGNAPGDALGVNARDTDGGLIGF